jgi:predicted amidohydrolase YtcJ
MMTIVTVLKGARTRVIDAGGATIVPGLHDAHGHFAGLGASLSNLNFRRTTSYQQVVEMVRQRAASHAARRMDPGPRLGSERLATEGLALE